MRPNQYTSWQEPPLPHAHFQWVISGEILSLNGLPDLSSLFGAAIDSPFLSIIGNEEFDELFLAEFAQRSGYVRDGVTGFGGQL